MKVVMKHVETCLKKTKSIKSAAAYHQLLVV